MPAILQDVPGHVRHQDFSQQGVLVRGGSNWDQSRTALETPITQLVDPEPVEVPVSEAYAPAPVVLKFAKNSAVVTQQGAKALTALKTADHVSVIGYADKSEKLPAQLAEKRAKAVAARLKSVPHVTVEGAVVPETAGASNRRVEVTRPPA